MRLRDKTKVLLVWFGILAQSQCIFQFKSLKSRQKAPILIFASAK
jgi:hypothetical protein